MKWEDLEAGDKIKTTDEYRKWYSDHFEDTNGWTSHIHTVIKYISSYANEIEILTDFGCYHMDRDGICNNRQVFEIVELNNNC